MTRELDLYQITASDQIDTYRLMAIDDCNELQKMLSIVSKCLVSKKKIPVIYEGDERELIDCASSLAIALATIREAVETYQLVSDRVADERDEITTRYVLAKGIVEVNADLDEAGLDFRLRTH
jgi:hypothetical protein